MYLVTGSTGNVGSEVVSQLLTAGRPVRVFSRDAGKVARWAGRVQVAVGDFGQLETFVRALDRVEAVFLMNAGRDVETLGRLIAVAAKVPQPPRVVFLSSTLAAHPQFAIGKLHQDVEGALRASGLAWKAVRPTGFMTNCLRWSGTIKAEGAVYNPLGAVPAPLVAPEDIAAVAVKALTDSQLAGEIFEVTGGELLTTARQVAILAGVLGKPLRCIDVSTETAVQNLIRGGVPAPLAAAIGGSYQAVRDGWVAGMTDTVRNVLGRPPMTFESWARKHAAGFA